MAFKYFKVIVRADYDITKLDKHARVVGGDKTKSEMTYIIIPDSVVKMMQVYNTDDGFLFFSEVKEGRK